MRVPARLTHCWARGLSCLSCVSRLVRGVARGVAGVARGVVGAPVAACRFVARLVRELVRGVRGLVRGLVRWVVAVVRAVVGAPVAAGRFLGRLVRELVRGVCDLVRGLVRWVAGVVRAVVGAPVAAGRFVARLVRELARRVGGLVRGLVRWVAGVVRAVVGAPVAAGRFLGRLVRGMVRGVVGAVRRLVRALLRGVTGLVRGLVYGVLFALIRGVVRALAPVRALARALRSALRRALARVRAGGRRVGGWWRGAVRWAREFGYDPKGVRHRQWRLGMRSRRLEVAAVLAALAVGVAGALLGGAGDGVREARASSMIADGVSRPGAVDAPAPAPDIGSTAGLTSLGQLPTVIAAPMTRSSPLRVRIPQLGTNAEVFGASLAPDGGPPSPSVEDAMRAAWYAGGVAPGESGAAILVGHLDTYTGPAAFAGLGQLRPGEIIEIDRQDGTTAFFAVDSVEQYPKTYFPDERVYGNVETPQLRLITCGGSWTAAGGYDSNIVAYAHLVAR